MAETRKSLFRPIDLIIARKAAIAHLRGIAFRRLADRFGKVGVAFHEAGGAFEHAQHVLRHQHLAIAPGRCADADHGYVDAGRDDVGQFLHHPFDHHAEGAGGRHGLGVAQYLGMFLLAFAACAIAAQRVHRLRRQADMGHHRDAALGQEADRFRHRLAAFQLDAGAAGFGHNAAGAGKGLLGRCLIGAEGHVDQDDAVIAAAHHGGAMGDHHVERDRQGGGQAIDDLGQRIADQQHVAMRIEQLRLARGIGGQHHQRLVGLALELAALDLGHGQPLHRRGRGIGAAGRGVEREGRGHGARSSPARGGVQMPDRPARHDARAGRPSCPCPIGSEGEFDRAAPGLGIADLAGDQAGIARRDLKIFDIVDVEGVAHPAEHIEAFAAEAGADVGQGIALHFGVDGR